jgi:hypothetical protein
MNMVSGLFNGTGANVTLCIGFIPDYVKVYNLEDAGSLFAKLEWWREMRLVGATRGLAEVTGTTYRAIDLRTVADEGIVLYRGGEILTTTNQTSTSYGAGVFLGWDKTDYKADLVNGVAAPITTWTLGSSTNRTGNFNANLLHALAAAGGNGTGSRIGVGSKIVIREAQTRATKEAFVEVGANAAAAAGSAANSVTLSEAIGSGEVLYIGGAMDMAPLAIGVTTSAGFTLEAATNINDTANEVHFFEAIKYS